MPPIASTSDSPSEDFEHITHVDTQPMDVGDGEASSDAKVQGPARAMALEISLAQEAFSHKDEHTVLSMASLQAPEASSEHVRPPLDLVLCIDKSGSMRGQKIKLVKETLHALIKKTGMNARDRVSLVSFDTDVKTELALTNMDSDGRLSAEKVVAGLIPGSTTNLSGGLFQSLDILNSNKPDESSRTRAVLLLTDGIANHGITSTTDLNIAVKNIIDGTSTKIFCFGFGSDHNENMLRGIASEASGLYYYIKSVDDIGSAFADCLGGIMSVVAQNAILTLTAAPDSGVSFAKVLGSYKVGAFKPGDAQVSVDLGDLYSEDAKDVLFEMKIPALPMAINDAAVQLHAKLRVFSVVTSRFEEATAEVALARPAETPPNQPTNLRLDEQRNRVLAAEAMEKASSLADAGDLSSGRLLLQEALMKCQASGSATSTLSAGLIEQMQQVQMTYCDEVKYRSVGSKMSKMHAMSNFRQQSNHMAPALFKGGAKGKGAVKRAWGLADEDDD